MDGALWFKENTLRRHPEVAPYHKWFEDGNDDEGSDNSDSDSDGDYAQTNTRLLCIVEVSIPRGKLNKRE